MCVCVCVCVCVCRRKFDLNNATFCTALQRVTVSLSSF